MNRTFVIHAFENQVGKFGGATRDRTADLLHAMQALSQLSYNPISRLSNHRRHIRIGWFPDGLASVTTRQARRILGSRPKCVNKKMSLGAQAANNCTTR